MNKITEAFKNKKAFIAFVTGGDPDLDTTRKLIAGLEEAGADLIEIGIPFSDPMAEGEVIQAADERALSAGCTTDKLFDLVKSARSDIKVPLLFMTYLNPIFTYGKDKFLARCREAGIDGVIVPDMPFEEKGEIDKDCGKYGITLISLISPTSRERISAIAKEAEGFLYCVSSRGVTGTRSEIGGSAVAEMIREAKAVSNIPCAVGFGVSTPEQVKELSAVSDGVIVGSAIVKIIAEHGKNSVAPVKEFVKKLTRNI